MVLYIILIFQSNEKIKVEEINTLYTQLMNKANSQMGSLQKKVEAQKNAEEKERLRKIQQEMEKQKKQKEDEERQKRDEEDNKKKYVLFIVFLINVYNQGIISMLSSVVQVPACDYFFPKNCDFSFPSLFPKAPILFQ